jgi:hypothetical protein
MAYVYFHKQAIYAYNWIIGTEHFLSYVQRIMQQVNGLLEFALISATCNSKYYYQTIRKPISNSLLTR